MTEPTVELSGELTRTSVPPAKAKPAELRSLGKASYFTRVVCDTHLMPDPEGGICKFLPGPSNILAGPKTSREGFAVRGRNMGGIEISRPQILPSGLRH